jgi:hypothetical protein
MSQVLEAAKQGDAQAIAALINRSLKPQGINAKVICENAQMKILLESLDIPNKDRLTDYVIQGLNRVGVAITRLEIYGKRTGQEGYAWTRAFQVDEQNQFIPVAAAAPQAQSTPAPAIADNPFLASADNSPVDQHSSTASTSGSSFNGNSSSDDILAMAQAGNLSAIESIVKAALADKEDLVPLVELNGDVLKVTIETQQFLDGPAFCGEFGTKMNVLAGGVVKELEVYKRKSEKTMPFLMKKATLFTKAEAEVADAPPEPLEPYTSSSSRPNGQSSAMRSTSRVPDEARALSRGRPTEISAIAFLYYFLGGLGVILSGLGIVAGIALLGMSASVGGEDGATAGGVSLVVLGLAVLSFALSVGRIAVGVGLMKMKRWSRTCVFVIEGLNILGCVVDILTGFKVWKFWKIGLAVGIIKTLIAIDDSLFID